MRSAVRTLQMEEAFVIFADPAGWRIGASDAGGALGP